MAKPNNKKGNKNQNNYFIQNIREKGKDFIHYKNPRELQNDALKIFRELARGQINIEDHGMYFLDPQFLASCVYAAESKYQYHAISQTGVDMYITQIMNSGSMPDSIVVGVKEDHKRKAEAYGLIYQSLCSISYTYDINSLYVLVSKLQNYKYNL